MLAPIEDITSLSFRILACRHGCDVAFTELIRFESLARNNKSTWERIEFSAKAPTVIQVIGQREMWLKKFLSSFVPGEGFKGFCLNLGCPAPNFVNQGVGAAMIKRISKVNKLIDVVKSRGYPVGVKMRLGLNQFEKDKKVYLNLLNSTNADYYIVHARHGKESYNVPADWSVFPECVATGKKIVANGDVKTVSDVKKLETMGVVGVMIGRAAVTNPGIFDTLKGKESASLDSLRKEYESLSANEPFRYKKNVLKWMGGKSLTEEKIS